MKPYYQDRGITIYQGRAEELVPRIEGLFETIVLDPPFTVRLDDYRERMPFPFLANAIVMLNPDHGFLRLGPDLLQDELQLDPEVAPIAAYGHPAVRPLEVMKRLLSLTSGRILDPYMGVGTTLVAARELGREAIGIELKEGHCSAAASRLRCMSLN